MASDATPNETAPFQLLVNATGSAYTVARDCGASPRSSAVSPDGRPRMSDETLDAYLRELFAASPDGPVEVVFQGGEPTLMGLDFFRRAVELAEKHRRPTQIAAFTVQTDALLLDAEWADFFAEEAFLVGVYIDGPASVHDIHRRTESGEPTHARVMESIALLNERKVEWNALVSVSSASEGLGAEVYEFLRDDASARFMQFAPVVERAKDEAGALVGTAVTERSVSAAGYGTFLSDVFDIWVRRDVGQAFVREFDIALTAWGDEGNPLCVHAPTCGRTLAMDAGGEVYPCEYFIEPGRLLGSLSETALAELVEAPEQQAFGQAKADAMPAACAECQVLFACNGGCPKDRFLPADSGPDSNYLCEGYLAFFQHIWEPMCVMAALHRAKRAPSEIVTMIAAQQQEESERLAATGRNEPCPCGSGRKYKQCHGAS